MPELPTYNAKQNVQPSTTAPLRQPDPLVNDAAQAGEDQQKILSTVATIGQKYSDANDVMQYTEAKAKHGVAVAQIEAAAALDPDFKNASKYHEQLVDVNKTFSKGIDNQMVASKANAEFEYDAGLASIKINGNFKQKQIAYNQVMVKTNLNTLMQQKLAAGTPAESAQYDLKIKDLLTENLHTGVLGYADAEKMLQESQKTSVQYQIYNDPSTAEKDSQLLSELKDPKGKYAFLEPKDRLDLIQESQRRIFQNNQTYKKEVEVSQVQRNDDIIEKMAKHEATFKDIDNEMAIPEEQGGIKRGTLLQYKRYMENGVERTLNEFMKEKVNGTKEATDRAKQATEYNALIENYLSDKTDQWQAKEMLATALADGHIDADELKVLNPLKANLKDIQFNKDTSFIASAVKQVKSWMHQSNASSEDIALRTKQLLQNVGAGDAPQVAMGKIMDAQMLSHFPDANTYPKQGKNFIDKKTSRSYRVYTEDGKVKWAWIDSTPSQGQK